MTTKVKFYYTNNATYEARRVREYFWDKTENVFQYAVFEKQESPDVIKFGDYTVDLKDVLAIKITHDDGVEKILKIKPTAIVRTEVTTKKQTQQGKPEKKKNNIIFKGDEELYIERIVAEEDGRWRNMDEPFIAFCNLLGTTVYLEKMKERCEHCSPCFSKQLFDAKADEMGYR